MTSRTFILTYQIVFKTGLSEVKKIKVKNCSSELDAKIKLDRYIHKHNKGVVDLIISKCTPIDASIPDIFNDIFSNFKL